MPAKIIDFRQARARLRPQQYSVYQQILRSLPSFQNIPEARRCARPGCDVLALPRHDLCGDCMPPRRCAGRGCHRIADTYYELCSCCGSYEEE